MGGPICGAATHAAARPQVFQGECCATSDVWSLGLTVIELATSEHPWRSTNATNNTDIICILAQRRCPEVPRIVGVPPPQTRAPAVTMGIAGPN